MDFDSFESRKRLELEAIFESRLQRDFFSFFLDFLIINLLLLLEVALPQSLKTTMLFLYWSSQERHLENLRVILSCASQAPIPCSPPPGDHVQTVLRACVTWDFPALLAKPWCLLTFSLVSPLLILLPPVCSLLFSHHEMLFPKAPSFVLFSLYFHTFPGWAPCLYY